MPYYSRNILAATDITFSPTILKKLRGKPAKETYRFVKGSILTGSVIGPGAYAGGQIATEMTKGVVYSCSGSVIESYIGYVSGLGFVRFLYKAADAGKIKTIARVGYNVLGLPITIYFKGTSVITDLLKLNKLEEIWFGAPVYVFDDNRLWLEKNFTAINVFKLAEGGE